MRRPTIGTYRGQIDCYTDYGNPTLTFEADYRFYDGVPPLFRDGRIAEPSEPALVDIFAIRFLDDDGEPVCGAYELLGEDIVNAIEAEILETIGGE